VQVVAADGQRDSVLGHVVETAVRIERVLQQHRRTGGQRGEGAVVAEHTNEGHRDQHDVVGPGSDRGGHGPAVPDHRGLVVAGELGHPGGPRRAEQHRRLSGVGRLRQVTRDARCASDRPGERAGTDVSGPGRTEPLGIAARAHDGDHRRLDPRPAHGRAQPAREVDAEQLVWDRDTVGPGRPQQLGQLSGVIPRVHPQHGRAESGHGELPRHGLDPVRQPDRDRVAPADAEAVQVECEIGGHRAQPVVGQLTACPTLDHRDGVGPFGRRLVEERDEPCGHGLSMPRWSRSVGPE
jgi:hypothetical protein